MRHTRCFKPKRLWYHRSTPRPRSRWCCSSIRKRNTLQYPANIKKIEEYKASENLLIDPATLQNLEIFKSATGHSNGKHGSLLHAMDGTVTPPGSRLLERWMAQPLLDLDTLNHRQNCVHEFVQAPGLATDLQNTLKQIRDIERILGRLQNRIQNPRELGGIRDSL